MQVLTNVGSTTAHKMPPVPSRIVHIRVSATKGIAETVLHVKISTNAK